MKNLPHQFNQLQKLTEALRVARDIVEDGGELGQDSVYGEALARAGVYTFRKQGNLEELVGRERTKPRSRRGTETAAREMRRFLRLSEFIEHDNVSDTYSISDRGVDLLQAESAEIRSAGWRRAMLDLALTDNQGNVSHPYRILVRPVSDNPGLETFKLVLAFEAQTDSADEYERISSHLRLDLPDLIKALDIGEANAKNAIKILPSIAEQVGDIRRTSRQSWPVEHLEIAEDGFEAVTERGARKRTTPRRRKAAGRKVSAESIASTPEFGEAEEVIIDLSDAISLRKRRTEQHQQVVRDLAGLLFEAGFDLYEDPYDCLACKDGSALLIEVKTLDGSPSDERRQAERALGQVKGYRHFDLPEELDARKVTELIAFSQKPTDEMRGFLNATGALVVWPAEDDSWWWSTVDGDVLPFEPHRMA